MSDEEEIVKISVRDMQIGKTYLLKHDEYLDFVHYTVLARTRNGDYLLLRNEMTGTEEWFSLARLSAMYRVIDEVEYGKNKKEVNKDAD